MFSIVMQIFGSCKKTFSLIFNFKIIFSSYRVCSIKENPAFNVKLLCLSARPCCKTVSHLPAQTFFGNRYFFGSILKRLGAFEKRDSGVRVRSAESEVKNTRSRSRAAAVENRIPLKAHCQGRSEHLVDKLQNLISPCTHPQSRTLSGDAPILPGGWAGGCVCRE